MNQFDIESINLAYMSTLRSRFKLEVPTFATPTDSIETLHENVEKFIALQGIESRVREFPTLKKALKHIGPDIGILECTMVNGLTFGAIGIDRQFFEHGSAKGFTKFASSNYRCVMFKRSQKGVH